tara:strand:- start:120 stop:572 length:453 start_codon:yes stop_codon:yes gene_type:complete
MRGRFIILFFIFLFTKNVIADSDSVILKKKIYPDSFNKLVLTGSEGYMTIKEDKIVAITKGIKKRFIKSKEIALYQVLFLDNDDQILFKSNIDNPFQAGLHDDEGKNVNFVLNNSYIEIYYPSEIEYSSIEIKSTYSNIYKNTQKITVQK